MDKMYAIVFFLAVITSSVSSTSTNNDDQKFAAMVVKDHTTTLKEVIEADIPLQVGRFKVKDGRILTLLMPVDTPTPNCEVLGAECTAWKFAFCCEGLHCGNGYTCEVNADCHPLGYEGCTVLTNQCCWPYTCEGPFAGTPKCSIRTEAVSV